jgi:MtN3 and saliva related transmembrane protein
MTPPELLGYCASIASGGAYFPQAVRALRTRQTRDLSLSSVALAACGTLLWAAYGHVIGSSPVLLSNLIVMPLAFATLTIKLQGLKDA